MTDYTEIIEAAIEKEKNTIVEELAVRQAQEVESIVVDDEGNVIEIKKDGKEALVDLVEKYRSLNGDISVFLIKRKIEAMDLKGVELPDILQ